MALSGTFRTNEVGYVDLQTGIEIVTKFRLDWSATQDPATNTSTITWALTTEQSPTGSGYKRTVYKRYVKVGTQTYNLSSALQVSNGTGVLSGTTVIQHDSNGQKTITISAGVAVADSSYNCTGSKSFTLNPISRASTITCASPQTMGDTASVTVTQNNANFSHILYYKTSLDDEYTEIGRHTATQTYSWTLPDITQDITTTDRDTYTLLCETYLSDDYTGDHIDTTLNIVAEIPANVVPSVTIDSITEGNADIENVLPFAIGYSKPIVQVTFTGADGSTCISKSVTVANETQVSSSSSATETFAMTQPIPFGWQGTLTATVTVTDSRGRTATASQIIFVVQYKDPQITDLFLTRCDSLGAVDPTGEYLLVKASWKATALAGAYSIKLYVNNSLEDTYTTNTATQNTLTQISILSGISASSVYEVKAEILDALADARDTMGIPQPYLIQTVPRADVPISFYDDGTDIGVTCGESASGAGFNLTQYMFERGNLTTYLMRKVKTLWENQSPTSSFSAQSIALNSDEYDYYEVIYNQTNNVDYYMSTGLIPKGHGTRLTAMFIATGGCGGRTRIVEYTDDTHLSVQVGRLLNSGQTSVSNDNTACIPIAVLGYKM